MQTQGRSWPQTGLPADPGAPGRQASQDVETIREALRRIHDALREIAERRPELVDDLVLLAEALRPSQVEVAPAAGAEPATPVLEDVPGRDEGGVAPEPKAHPVATPTEDDLEPARVEPQPDSLEPAISDWTSELPEWKRTRVRLDLVVQRARLKAEALDWALRRRELLDTGVEFDKEIKPNDKGLLERSAALEECFLWMLQPHGPQDSATELELREIAAAYRAVEMAAEAANGWDTDDEALLGDRALPTFLQLVAEAQSALVTGLRSCQVGRDQDQWDLWCWVRQATDHHRVFLDRYMSHEHPAHPRDLVDFPDRIGELVDQVEARREREKRRRSRVRRIEYHVKIIEEAVSRGMEPEHPSLVHDWNRVTETITEWISDGNHVTDERLLAAVATVATEVPDSLVVGNVATALEAVESWLAARSELHAEVGREADDEVSPDAAKSVRQAYERVLRRHPDRIVLALNNRSDPDYDYARPAEVEQVFEWLATVLWESRERPGSGGGHRTLNLDLMERCGWFYRPTQAATTMGRFPDWYRCNHEGRSLSLEEHVGRGNTKRQGRNSIRIAFAWDAESGRVVIGFLGQHQRTTRT